MHLFPLTISAAVRAAGPVAARVYVVQTNVPGCLYPSSAAAAAVAVTGSILLPVRPGRTPVY